MLFASEGALRAKFDQIEEMGSKRMQVLEVSPMKESLTLTAVEAGFYQQRERYVPRVGCLFCLQRYTLADS